MSGIDHYGRVTARYYDGAYARLRDPSGDLEFYRQLAREAQGPVLELGVGTGRVLLAIAADGIPCSGLDLSPHMLEGLRRKGFPPTLRLVQAPMQDFDLGDERFALIFAPFRVFQHLYTVEDQLACLACVRRHLAPGGQLAFDVFNGRLDRLALPEEPEAEDARFEQDGEEVVRYTAVTREHAEQLMRVRMRYERRRGGRVVGEERTGFPMRYFFRYEIEHLLVRTGFELLHLFGDFRRSAFGGDSPEMVFVARAVGE